MNKIFFFAAIVSAFFVQAQTASAAVERKGISLAAVGDFLSAESWFRQQVKIDPDDHTSQSCLDVVVDLQKKVITRQYALLFFKGLDLFQRGSVDQAIEALKEAVSSDPLYPRPHNVLGMIYASMGDQDAAIFYFKEGLRIWPGYSKAAVNLSSLYAAVNDIGKAIGVLEDALKNNPSDKELLKALALLYSSQEEYVRALSCYEKLITVDPGDPEAYYGAGLTCFMTSRFEKFKKYMTRSLEIYRLKNDAAGVERAKQYLARAEKIEGNVAKADK